MNPASQGSGEGRAAHSQAQHERILLAAQQCFAEHGFHAASMAMIAETAGISVGLIYRYFKSKSELIQGIVARQMVALTDEMKDMQGCNRPPPEKILDIFRPEPEARRCGPRHLEPALTLEITAEASRDALIAQSLERFDRHIENALHQWLAQPLEAGGFGLSAADIPTRARILRALVDGFKMQQVREGEAFNLEHLQQALEDVLPKLMA